MRLLKRQIEQKAFNWDIFDMRGEYAERSAVLLSPLAGPRRLQGNPVNDTFAGMISSCRYASLSENWPMSLPLTFVLRYLRYIAYLTRH